MDPKALGSTEPAPSERGQVLADISNAIVRIHKRFYGKGPVKARAHLSHDLLTVILEGGYTRGEQTLRDHGLAQEVVRSRLAMQSSIESEFRAAIESILYRSVRSFMSANDPSNSLQAEIFVLEPRGAETLEELATEDGSATDRTAQLDGTPESAGAAESNSRAEPAVMQDREVSDETRSLAASSAGIAGR
jgi:uncharacterized protein YbcI